MATQENRKQDQEKQNPKMPVPDWFGMGQVLVAAGRVSIQSYLSFMVASLRRLRTAATTPATPVPRSNSVAGSGVATVIV